jgi:hypothetical protein
MLPDHISTREAIFKEWLQIVKDKTQWKQIIEEYFEKCKTVEKDPDSKYNENTKDEDYYNYEYGGKNRYGS